MNPDSGQRETHGRTAANVYAERFREVKRLRLRNAELEQALAEKERKEDAALLTQFTVDYAGEIILWIGPDANFTYANETACKVLGYTRDELFKLKLFDIDPDVTRETWPQPWQQVMARGTYTFQTTFVTRDGAILPIEVCNHYMEYKNSKIICSFCRDITNRRNSEEALRAAKDEADRANRAKSRFLAAASHDLRQPLQSLSLLHHALAQCEVDDHAKEIVADLGYSVAVMGNMLSRLLDISKLDAGAIIPTIEDIPIEEMLQRIQRLFSSHAEQNDIILDVVPNSAFVRSDVFLLGQMLENLMANAIHHSKARRVLVGCRRSGNTLKFQIWDDGVGIPEDQLESIFEEYYQLDNPARDRDFGLGLGLSIVRRAGQLLGHSVSVASEVGKFTRFCVDLPLVEAIEAPADLEPCAIDAPDDFATCLAVLVEDDEVVLKAFRMLMEAWGFKVIGGPDADSIRDDLLNEPMAPSIVIADYRLGSGRTGPGEIGHIRSLIDKDVPGIIITGDISPKIQGLLAETALPVLCKPIDPQQLRDMLQELIAPIH